MPQLNIVPELFDEKYYSRLYGVEESHALSHFLDHGLSQRTNPHPLFDTDWYLRQRPDVALAGMNPLEHYCTHGAAEKVDPHPLFDTVWYLECHPDVAAMGQNPLVHYIRHGAAEHWDPHPLFDTKWYLKHYPEVKEFEQSPLIHYIIIGADRAYNPHPLFNTRWYVAQRPDVAAAGHNPLAHYITSGAQERVDPHPIFATGWYLKLHKDVEEARQNPLVHYLRYGAAEGWDPHPLFDTKWYLSDQLNIAISGINPLIHYVESDAYKKHNPHPLFDTNWYLTKRPDIVAAGVNPLAHYIESGSAEGTDPHPWFNTQFYWKNVSSPRKHNNALLDYLSQIWNDVSPPNPLFDSEWYMKTNPDVVSAGVNPFLHWIISGHLESRSPTPLFDPDYYLSRNPDVAAAGIPALEHFMNVGHAELRNPHPLFDTAWYIKNNLKGAPGGVNPLIHFAEFGAIYELDPSPRFSTSKYFDANPDLRQKKINALAHYITWGRETAAEIYSSDLDSRMSELYLAASDISASAMMGLLEADLGSVTRHFFYKPLNITVEPSLSATARLHILMPGLNRRYATGGPNTAYILGCLLAKEGLPVTFVSIDVPPDPDIQPLIAHLEGLTGLNLSELDVQFADASDRGQPYSIGIRDVFMATAWWTAQAAKSAAALTNNPRFYYLIQDLENTFYGGSVLHSVSRETYSFNHQPIINTSFLRDQLAAEKFGRYRDQNFVNDAIVFEPAVDRSHFFPEHKTNSGPRRLLFYARPTMAERNLFGLGVASLRALASNGIFEGSDWEFIGMGEDFEPISLGGGYVLRPAPWLDFNGYAELMRSADVLLSLMFSPHPSYPPLEMAVCGNPVVTTTYGVKTSSRLNSLSNNIIAVEPTLESIVFGMTRALTRRDNDIYRRAVDSSILPCTWTDSLSKILPKLLKELRADGIVSRDKDRNSPLASHRPTTPLPRELSLTILNRRSKFRAPSSGRKFWILMDDDIDIQTIRKMEAQILAQDTNLTFVTFDKSDLPIAGTGSNYSRESVVDLLSVSMFKRSTEGHARDISLDYLLLMAKDYVLLPDAFRAMQAVIEQTGGPPIIKFDADLSLSGYSCAPIYVLSATLALELANKSALADISAWTDAATRVWHNDMHRNNWVREIIAMRPLSCDDVCLVSAETVAD